MNLAFAEGPEVVFFLELEWAAKDRPEITALIWEGWAETVPDPKQLKYWLATELGGAVLATARWMSLLRLAYALWLQLPPELAVTSPLSVLTPDR